LKFIESCYSLACTNCEHERDTWKAIEGEKILFRDYMKTDKILHDSSYSRLDAAKFVDPILCTVLDTRKKKWLIVDGLHRANALTHLCDNVFAHMPTITIVECYGGRVDVIYPCDVHQLPKGK
jgi:hypothetical protein